MCTYDPEQAPVPDVWLAIDEHERLEAVLLWHKKARVELPNEMLHAVVHTIIENQLAEEVPSVVRAIPRLMQEGLTRHEAIHAVGMVLSRYIYELRNSPEPPTDPDASHARYEAAVDSLTADDWWSLAD